MSSKTTTKNVSITAEEAIALEDTVQNNSQLSPKDKEIILGLITFNSWLQRSLVETKLSINRLKGLFGIKTEKKR